MFPVFAIPIMALALVAWAVAARRLSETAAARRADRRSILLACGAWTLVRTAGFSGYIDHDFALRWTKTPEERLLAQANDEPPARPAPGSLPSRLADKPAAAPAADAPAAARARPGAGHGRPRGVAGLPRPAARRHRSRREDRNRLDEVAAGRTLAAADRAGLGLPSPCAAICIYTQEQRGDDEIVAAYALTHRQAGVAAPRRGALLGIERRPRSARHAGPSATDASTRWARRAS